jgi:adenine-specific DNA-methyltransferase
VIKYLGSKRTLVPALGQIASAVGASTALDMFTGTTRVAQEFKRRGIAVTCVDSATYSDILARCFIATDARDVGASEVSEVLAHLSSLPGRPGYFTRTFCEESRYVQPFNGERIDSIRDCLRDEYASDPLYPVLLTALMLATDRVDSTTGVQMAYLKKWAPRSYNPLDLRTPDLIQGFGRSVLGDAMSVVDALPRVDLAYLDPPYNQHRYFTNYHVWETLVRWDSPEHYGVACKRVDAREEETRSVFNTKPGMPAALESLIGRVRADVVVVSYNDESWVRPEQISRWLRAAGHEKVGVLGFDRKRYVGAQIGIFNPQGEKVGAVSHLRNQEHLFLVGPSRAVVESALAAIRPTAGPRQASLMEATA